MLYILLYTAQPLLLTILDGRRIRWKYLLTFILFSEEDEKSWSWVIGVLSQKWNVALSSGPLFADNVVLSPAPAYPAWTSLRTTSSTGEHRGFSGQNRPPCAVCLKEVFDVLQVSGFAWCVCFLDLLLLHVHGLPGHGHPLLGAAHSLCRPGVRSPDKF